MLKNWYVLLSYDKNDWTFIFRELDFLSQHLSEYDQKGSMLIMSVNIGFIALVTRTFPALKITCVNVHLKCSPAEIWTPIIMTFST